MLRFPTKNRFEPEPERRIRSVVCPVRVYAYRVRSTVHGTGAVTLSRTRLDAPLWWCVRSRVTCASWSRRAYGSVVTRAERFHTVGSSCVLPRDPI